MSAVDNYVILRNPPNQRDSRFVRNRTDFRLVSRGMDKPSTLRQKAAQIFRNAASCTTTAEAEKLNEVGCQLELWADDLEEMDTPPEQKHPSSE